MIVIKNASIRKAMKFSIPLVIPLIIAIGIYIFEEKRFALISLTIVLLAFLLFVSGFEKRNIGTRRLVLISIMVALSVAGRFIPFFKPITALTVITAMYIGAEAGFLTGSLSAVISDFYFGQGPWTPFQMFAWGMIGFLAGLLASPLKKSRPLLLFYGVFAAISFSLIMDVWTVIWYSGAFNVKLYIAAIISALPYTILYSVSNILFLWFFAKPFGEKLERVKLKYGI